MSSIEDGNVHKPATCSAIDRIISSLMQNELVDSYECSVMIRLALMLTVQETETKLG